MLDATAFGFDDYDGDDDSDSDSDATDSDSEYERRRSKKKKRRGSSVTRKGKEGGRGKTTVSAKGKAKFVGNEDEIAGMIKQLNSMKLEDPDYAPTYYKVLALDQTGNAAQCVKSPAQARAMIQQPGIARRPSYTTNPPPVRVSETPGGAVPRPSVATYPNNIPLGELVCYGCGKPGHRMDKCEGINELVLRGILGHNAETRRLELRSGAPLRRLAGEWLLDAVERITKGQQKSSVMLTFTGPMTGTARAVQNFYQSHASVRDLSTDESDLEEDYQQEYGSSTNDEEDDHTVYLSVPKTVQFDRQTAQIYEADRTVPGIRQARRMAFDGVEMPPRRHGAGPSAPLTSARRNIPRVPPSKASSTAPVGPVPPTQDDPASGRAELDIKTSGARQAMRPPTPPLSHTKNSLPLLGENGRMEMFRRGHARNEHSGPSSRSSDPERSREVRDADGERDFHWTARNVDKDLILHGTWGASVNGELASRTDASFGTSKTMQPERGDEYKSKGWARTTPPLNTNPTVSIPRQHHLYWIPKRLPLDNPASIMDLQFPSTPPPRLLTPAILAPPIYVSPTLPEWSNNTTVFNRAEVTAVQVLASMRDRSLAYHSGRPTILRQFSTDQLQPPARVVAIERPRSAQPNRPPTPYPHLDGVIVEAVRRLQAAVINGGVCESVGTRDVASVGRARGLGNAFGRRTSGYNPERDTSYIPIVVDTGANFSKVGGGDDLSMTMNIAESIARQPTPTLEAFNLPSTASVSRQVVQGLQQVGLPAFCPPATQSLPLFRPIPEFDPTILAFLNHYLQGAPVLTGLTRAVDEVRRLVPPAQQAETHARVLAGVLPALERRANQAQSQLAPDLVHGWVIFFEAVREAQSVLDERAREQIEEACRATADYQAWMTRVNEEIDIRGKEEMEAYQLTQVMMDTPSATASIGYSTPFDDLGTYTSRDEMVGENDALDLELLDATMEAAQLSMAAMHIADGEDEREAQTKDEDGSGLTAERESERDTWEVHVHEASYWGFFSSSSTASPPPDTPSVPLQFTTGVRPSSSTYSLIENEADSTDRAISVSSSDSSDDEVVPQYLQAARDLGHEGRYDEAREYWWAALNGTGSADDLSSVDFTSALSSPTYEPTVPLEAENWSWINGFSHSSTMTPETFAAADDEDEEAPLGLESLIHSQLIEEGTTIIPPNDSLPQTEAVIGHNRVASTYPEYRARIATAFIPPLPTAVFEGKQDPRPWYRLEPTYLENNPMMEPYHNRPVYDDLPKLKLSDYAKAGAFKSAPLHLGLHKSSRSASVPLSAATTPPAPPSPSLDSISPSGSPTMSPQPFTQHIADLRRHIFPYEGDSVGGRMFDELAGMTRALDVEHALAFSWLHKAAHLAYDQNGLGQLVDYERMREPNGQRVEFDWDVFEKPIVVDAERDELKEHFFYGHHFDLLQAAYELRQSLLSAVRLALPFLGRSGADLTHAFYQWLRTHRYATRRRFFWVFPLLRRHEMGLCETLYSLLVEHGYSREADELWRVLRVRYVCEDILGRFLRDGFLDITRQHGDAEYWTRDLPGLIHDDKLLALDDDDKNSDCKSAESTTSESSSDISFSYFTGAYYWDAESQYPSDEGSDNDEVAEAVANFSLALSGPSHPRPGFTLTLPTSRRAVPAGSENSDARPATVEDDDAATRDDRTLEIGDKAVVENSGDTTSTA
ncbi:hypothetical protein C8F01DRAFT_1261626 [Mycena amicta]|nr:hypothetical protein C8F01DRAFT_1261626 [Mycena amicta]